MTGAARAGGLCREKVWSNGSWSRREQQLQWVTQESRDERSLVSIPDRRDPVSCVKQWICVLDLDFVLDSCFENLLLVTKRRLLSSWVLLVALYFYHGVIEACPSIK